MKWRTAAIGATLTYWGLAVPPSMWFVHCASDPIAGAGWMALLAGFPFGFYLAWLATRAQRQLGNAQLGALIMVPAFAAAAICASLVAGFPDEPAKRMVASGFATCGLLGALAARAAAPRIDEASWTRSAWLYLPLVPVLALSFASELVRIELGALLIPVAIVLVDRYGRQGLLVIAVGTGLLMQVLELNDRWTLIFWPWGTFALLAAATLLFAGAIKSGVTRWTRAWMAPFVIALLLQSGARLQVLDGLSFQASFYLVLRAASFWIGLHAGAESRRLHRAVGGLFASSLALWILTFALPRESGWLGAAAGGISIAMVPNALDETLWCLLLIALGLAISGSGPPRYVQASRRLWFQPVFLIGLMVMQPISMTLHTASPLSGESFRFGVLSSAGVPELIPAAAFAAGYFRPKDGIPLAFVTALAVTVVLPFLFDISSAPVRSEGSWIEVGLWTGRLDAAMPVTAAIFALAGRRASRVAEGRACPDGP